MDAVRYAFFHHHLGKAHSLLNLSLFYVAGYGAIFALGTRIHAVPRRALIAMAGVSAVVYAAICSALFMQTGHFVPTQNFKYPPQLYYISYALAISLALISVRQPLANLVPQGKLRNIISFIGSNTLGIYLWHILTIKVISSVTHKGLWPDNFMAAWFGTAALAIFIVWAQKNLVSHGLLYVPSRWRSFATMSAGDHPPPKTVLKD